MGGHLRWQVDAAHGGYEEAVGVHQEDLLEQRPGDQAGRHVEADHPGCEHRCFRCPRLLASTSPRDLGPVPAIGPPKRYDAAPGSRVATSKVALVYSDLGH